MAKINSLQFKSIYRLLAAGLLVLAVVIASISQVHAARSFDSVRLNTVDVGDDDAWSEPWTPDDDGSIAWVQPEGDVWVEANVALDNSGVATVWSCTEVTINGLTGHFQHEEHEGESPTPEVFSEVFELEAPDEDGEYDIAINARPQHGDGDDCSSTGGTLFTLEESLWVDGTDPEIEFLNDEDEINIVQGSTFNAEGFASVIDNLDDNVELEIISDTVNTAEIGTYSVVYGATDAAGNDAERTLTVHVLSFEEEAGPNGGDANDDGFQDSEQDNVTSFVNPLTGNYAVLVADDDDCTIDSVIIAAEAANAVTDSGYDYPDGLMNFTIDCGIGFAGQTLQIQQLYYGDLDADKVTVRKYNPDTSGYQPIEGADVENIEIGGLPVLAVTFNITDGGALDLNGEEDGVIVDPSGPGVSVVGTPNTGLGGSKQPAVVLSPLHSFGL